MTELLFSLAPSLVIGVLFGLFVDVDVDWDWFKYCCLSMGCLILFFVVPIPILEISVKLWREGHFTQTEVLFILVLVVFFSLLICECVRLLRYYKKCRKEISDKISWAFNFKYKIGIEEWHARAEYQDKLSKMMRGNYENRRLGKYIFDYKIRFTKNLYMQMYRDLIFEKYLREKYPNSRDQDCEIKP